ncbi:MAG: prepilin-type N-terminal cleavage/methylation domain-containing protein [bacterium]
MQPAGLPRRQAQAGVTLVEILVVLSIIAITTGAAMLRLGIGASEDRLASTAQTLALAITQSSDAALATGEDRLLDLGPQAYRLHPASAADSQWTPTDGLTFTDPAPVTVRFAADGTSLPFQLHLSQDDRSILITFDGLRATIGPVGP